MRNRPTCFCLLAWLVLPGICSAEEAPAPQPGVCLENLSSYDEHAESACSDAIARLSSSAMLTETEQTALAAAYNNRAIARIRGTNYEGAEVDFQKAMTLAPISWSVILNRGNLYLAQGRFQDALNDYAEAELSAGRPLAAARTNSALAYRGLGDLNNAELSQQAADSLPDSQPPPGPLPPVPLSPAPLSPALLSPAPL